MAQSTQLVIITEISKSLKDPKLYQAYGYTSIVSIETLLEDYNYDYDEIYSIYSNYLNDNPLMNKGTVVGFKGDNAYKWRGIVLEIYPKTQYPSGAYKVLTSNFSITTWEASEVINLGIYVDITAIEDLITDKTDLETINSILEDVSTHPEYWNDSQTTASKKANFYYYFNKKEMNDAKELIEGEEETPENPESDN